jgi:hypothetical protein
MNLLRGVQCTLCLETFSTRQELAEHIRMGHDNKVFCEVCRKSYVNILDHYRHSKTHQRKKEEQNLSQALIDHQLSTLLYNFYKS